MYIDKDKKNLTSKQKLGKYNILLSVFKIASIIVFIIIQIIAICLIVRYKYATYGYIIISLLAILHLFLFSQIKEYKTLWFILIIVFPIIGVLMYFLIGNISFNKNRKKQLNKIDEEGISIINNSNYVEVEELKSMTNFSKYKVYKNQGIKFFNTGEEFFDDLLNEMKNAKKSILIDIYILSKGILFNQFLEILSKKVKEGVIVELIYDDLGAMFKLPKKIKESIIESGIKLYKYEKINLNTAECINYREHKKIFLIDGQIAYTGGVNISDEYINKKELHRIWKDGGIKIYGDIAISYLLMYLKTKEEITKEKSNYKKYILDRKFDNMEGSVFAYSDGPDEDKNPVENIFLNIINNSKKHLYIATPYFIPNKKIVDSIKNASKRNVDVKILLPHIPDKKIVQYANRSFYKELLESGVKVYEYKKGFTHSKYIVSDNISTVGTANLDYRSLYFNFECMNLSYNTGIEKKIKEEFEKDIKDAICINLNDVNNQNIIEKIRECIAHFLAPIL